MRCQATRSICVNWEYREKRDGALLIIESGNGSAGWLGVEALRPVYLGASSRSQTFSPLHPALSFFLLSVFWPGPAHPVAGESGPWGFWQMRLGRWFQARASISLLLMVESGLQKSNSLERLERFVSASARALGLLWRCWNTEGLTERRQLVSPREGQIKK